jgi:uncharacterized small protein (DUF1192 family)
MSLFEDDKPVKKASHEIGVDLAALSADELARRVALLKDEIVRIETEIAAKSSSRSVAEGLFKK